MGEERGMGSHPKWQRIMAGVEATSAAQTEGFVYFIACGPYVKIGYSYSPLERAASMATNNPYPCALIGLVRGGKIREKEIHGQFAANRHRNEWFHLTPEVRSAISALCGEDWASAAPSGSRSLINDALERRYGWT